MASITTESLNGVPSATNLGGTPLHPMSSMQGASLPASLARSGSSPTMNGGLNDPEPGMWSTLTPNVSDPSKFVSNA